MAGFVILLLVLLRLVASQSSHAIDTTEFRNAIWRAYDHRKSFEENFYSILGDLCPESVYCRTPTTWTANQPDFQDNSQDAREILRNISNTLTGCCEPCSCDNNDCMERRTCCLGVDFDMAQSTDAKIETNMTQECVIASMKSYKSQSSGFLLGPLDKSYYMITDCFAVNSNEETVTKCRSPKIENPTEITPVYSSNAKKIFKNVFCAECNGENDTVSWQLLLNFNLRVTFTDEYPVLTVPQELYDSHVSMRSKVSELGFVPPQEMLSIQKDFSCTMQFRDLGNICEINLITKNDETDFFTRACAMQSRPYHETYSWYDNVYCYLCQSTISIKQKSKCTRDDGERITGDSFSALFVIPEAESQTSDVRDRNVPCRCTEYHDEKRNTCRQLICPPGWTYMRCRCVEFLTNVTGMPVKLYLDLSIEQYTDRVRKKIGDPLEDRTATRLVSKAEKMLKSQWGPIDIQLLALYRKLNRSEIPSLRLYTIYYLILKSQTDSRQLIREMFEALDTGITITVSTISVKLTFGQVRPLDQHINRTSSIIFEQNGKSEESLPVHILSPITPLRSSLSSVQLVSKLVYCMRVKLEDDEVDLVRNNASDLGFKNSRIRYILYETDSSICLDEFERAAYFAQSKATRSNHTLSALSLLFLVWIVIVPSTHSALVTT